MAVSSWNLRPIVSDIEASSPQPPAATSPQGWGYLHRAASSRGSGSQVEPLPRPAWLEPLPRRFIARFREPYRAASPLGLANLYRAASSRGSGYLYRAASSRGSGHLYRAASSRGSGSHIEQLPLLGLANLYRAASSRGSGYLYRAASSRGSGHLYRAASSRGSGYLHRAVSPRGARSPHRQLLGAVRGTYTRNTKRSPQSAHAGGGQREEGGCDETVVATCRIALFALSAVASAQDAVLEGYVRDDLQLISQQSLPTWSARWTGPIEAATILAWLADHGYGQFVRDYNGDGVVDEQDTIRLADDLGRMLMATETRRGTTDVRLVLGLAQYVAGLYPNEFVLKIYDVGFPGEVAPGGPRRLLADHGPRHRARGEGRTEHRGVQGGDAGRRGRDPRPLRESGREQHLPRRPLVPVREHGRRVHADRPRLVGRGSLARGDPGPGLWRPSAS